LLSSAEHFFLNLPFDSVGVDLLLFSTLIDLLFPFICMVPAEDDEEEVTTCCGLMMVSEVCDDDDDVAVVIVLMLLGVIDCGDEKVVGGVSIRVAVGSSVIRGGTEMGFTAAIAVMADLGVSAIITAAIAFATIMELRSVGVEVVEE
jgi:hypothetical protein